MRALKQEMDNKVQTFEQAKVQLQVSNKFSIYPSFFLPPLSISADHTFLSSCGTVICTWYTAGRDLNSRKCLRGHHRTSSNLFFSLSPSRTHTPKHPSLIDWNWYVVDAKKISWFCLETIRNYRVRFSTFKL